MFQDQREARLSSPDDAAVNSGLHVRSLEATESGDTPPEEDGARPEGKSTNQRKTSTFIRELIETVLLTLIIFLGVRSVVNNFKVEGDSMFPSLHNGEYLLVNKAVYAHIDVNALRNLLPGEKVVGEHVVYFFHQPQRGDIIIFDPPTPSDKPYVKRVIGLAGDRIAFRDGRVFVNGRPLDEAYIGQATTPRSYPPPNGEFIVPPGEVFVLGDNRNSSQDSRSFGPVTLDRVIGKAIISYWPPDEFGLIPHAQYAGADTGK